MTSFRKLVIETKDGTYHGRVELWDNDLNMKVSHVDSAEPYSTMEGACTAAMNLQQDWMRLKNPGQFPEILG